MRCIFVILATALLGCPAADAQPTTNSLPMLREFPLPSVEGRLAWDGPRRVVYVADSVTRKIDRLNVDSGIQQGEITFTNAPERMALSADGAELLVTLLAQPHSQTWFENQWGYLSVIDAQTFRESRRFRLDIDPFDLVRTPSGSIAVSSGSGQWTYVDTYNLITGTRLGSVSGVIYEQSRLSLHPDGRRLYVSGGSVLQRLDLDPQTGAFGHVGDQVQVLPSYSSGVWIHPNGRLLIGDAANLFYCDAVRTNDLKPAGVLEGGAFFSLAFDVPNKAFFVTSGGGNGGQIVQYHLDSLQMAARYSAGGTPLGIYVQGNELWLAVATNASQALVRRLGNPASGGETNQPPAAVVTITPPSPSTLALVTFDASASSDDQGPAVPLWFRWDLDGDGVFDTEFSRNPAFSINFNVAGSRFVILQARDRFGATSSVTNSFEVRLEEDPGRPVASHPAYQLPFAAERVAFDTARDRLYLTDSTRRSLVVVDLQTGFALRQYDFYRAPESLAVTPDGHWLYAALLAAPHSSFRYDGGNGFVAEFDLERGVKTREFFVAVDPGSVLATDSRIVVIGGGSGQLTRIQSYDAASGLRRGDQELRELASTVLLPSQRLVLAADGHTAGAEITTFDLDPAVGTLVQRDYLNLDGFRETALSLNDSAKLCGSAAGSLIPLATNGAPGGPVRNLESSQLSSALVFDASSRGMVFAAIDRELRCYNLQTLYLARTVALTAPAAFLGRKADKLYAVSVSNSVTAIQVLTNPALGSEGNKPPVIDLERVTAAPTTRFPVVMNASATTDDSGPLDSLQFRWDVNGDGVFDTPWTNLTTVSQRFLVSGNYRMIVEARDTWGAVSRAESAFAVALEADPGEAGPAHAPWQIPFAAADAAFDTGRRRVWLSDPEGLSIARVSLTNGLIEKRWTFPYPPESLAITPDGRHLYAALLAHPHDYYWRDQEGYIAEFDLEADVEARVLKVGIDPGDLAATDAGLLFVAGGSGGETSVDCLRAATGALVGRVPEYNGMKVRVGPSQSRVFGAAIGNPYITRFTFDPVAGVFSAGPQSPSFQPEIEGVGGRVFVLPGETNLLGGGGAVYLSRPGDTDDLRVISNLGLSPVTDEAELPGAGLIGVLSGTRIGYYRTAGLQSAGVYQLGRPAQWLGAFADAHFLLSVSDQFTLISRRIGPASDPTTNHPPVVRWLEPPSGSVFGWPAAFRLATEPEDTDGGIERVEFRRNGQTLGVATNYPFSIDVGTLPAGNHVIEALARDNLGATSTVQSIAVRIDLRPALHWITPVGITVVDPGSNVPLEVSAGDADGSVARVQFYQGSLLSSNLLGTLTAPPWRWVVSNLTANTYFIAQATDNDGITSNTPPALVQVAGPRGDDFYRPFVLVGTNANVTANNGSATAQWFEKPILGSVAYHSLWWSWKAPVAGLYTITTRGSSFDTLLGVYLGSDVGNLTLIALNDDDPGNVPASTTKFAALAGTTYQFAVDGYLGATGLVNLTLAFETPLITPPANDNFANRFSLTGTNVLAQGSNVGATAEAGEPRHAGMGAGQSVWWEWMAPTNGIARLTTANSVFDTVLAVYTGIAPPFSSLRSLVSNDDDPAGGTTSTVRFNAIAGTRYFIAVTGFSGTTGEIRLKLDLSPIGGTGPVNDAFAARLPLTGSDLLVEGSNIGATAEFGEPYVSSGPPRATVWWSWRSPGWGSAFLRVQGGGFTAVAAVFTGTSVTNLTRRADTTDPGKQGTLTFAASAGVEYNIAVDGQNSQTGPFTLTLTTPAMIGPPRVAIDAPLPDGRIALKCEDCVDGAVVVDVSTDLIEWQALTTNQVVAGASFLLAPDGQSKRFYRLRIQ